MSNGEDLFRQIAGAGGRIDPRLSDRDVERLVAAARRRRERRASVRRAVLAAGATACLALTGALAVHRVRRPPVAEVPTASQAARPTDNKAIVRLSDGSTAVPLDAETQIDVVEDGSNRVKLSLVRGRGRFQVTPGRSAPSSWGPATSRLRSWGLSSPSNGSPIGSAWPSSAGLSVSIGSPVRHR